MYRHYWKACKNSLPEQGAAIKLAFIAASKDKREQKKNLQEEAVYEFHRRVFAPLPFMLVYNSKLQVFHLW